jgi:hypothetical protein
MFKIAGKKLNNILLRSSSTNFYRKNNVITTGQVVTYNVFNNGYLQTCFLSTNMKGGTKGTLGSKGNRGGVGNRGPNQRVPNNPGQNRGNNRKRKNNKSDNDNSNSWDRPKGNKNQQNRGAESKKKNKSHNAAAGGINNPLATHSEAFDEQGNWIAPSQREFRKAKLNKKRQIDMDSNWTDGPQLRRKSGEQHSTNKYIDDGREHDIAPNRGGGNFGNKKDKNQAPNSIPEYITQEDVLIYQLEDNVEFLKYIEKETAECMLKTPKHDDRLKYALRLLHLRASRIRFSDVLKDAREDLQYGFKVADIIKTIMTEETYSKHRWSMWSEKHQYEIGDIVTVPTQENFGRYLYKLRSADESKQGKPGTPSGSGWKCYQFTDPYVYSKVDAMNEMLELYLKYGDDGIQFQQYIDGYSPKKPKSNVFKKIEAERAKIIHKYRDTDMAGTVLNEFWNDRDFDVKKFLEMNREASAYFANIMLEIGVEKELESLELINEANTLLSNRRFSDADIRNSNNTRNNVHIVISDDEVKQYKRVLKKKINEPYSAKSGISKADFEALKEQFQRNLNCSTDADFKMHLYVKKKIQLIRDAATKRGLNLEDVYFDNDDFKSFVGIIEDQSEDATKYGNVHELNKAVLQYIGMQQKISPGERATEVERRLKGIYSGNELKKKLKIFDAVQEILEDDMSQEFSTYKDEMSNLYSKDGFFYDEFNAIGDIHRDLKLNYGSGDGDQLNSSQNFYLYMNDESKTIDDKYFETDVYKRYADWKESELKLAEDFIATSHHFSGIQDVKDAENEKEYQRYARDNGIPIPLEIQIENELPDLFWNDQVPGEVIPIVQDKIYDLNTANPEYWTAERLSQQFRVHPLRVKAILKIKNHSLKRIQKDREEWREFTKERDVILSQVCEIWSNRLKNENDGILPSDTVVELKDIKEFVNNALDGVADSENGGEEGNENKDDEETKCGDDDDGEDVATVASGLEHDSVETTVDASMINDAKELRKLLDIIEDKDLWIKNKDVKKMTTKTIRNEDGEEETVEVEEQKDIALEDRDQDYIFDIYDDAMNRAYLAIFPLYFEQFVDKDLAGKELRKNKPFSGLRDKADMTKAKKKIIDRVGYIQRRKQGRKDSSPGFIEKQDEGWTLEYTSLPTKKKFK